MNKPSSFTLVPLLLLIFQSFDLDYSWISFKICLRGFSSGYPCLILQDVKGPFSVFWNTLGLLLCTHFSSFAIDVYLFVSLNCQLLQPRLWHPSSSHRVGNKAWHTIKSWINICWVCKWKNEFRVTGAEIFETSWHFECRKEFLKSFVLQLQRRVWEYSGFFNDFVYFRLRCSSSKLSLMT